MKRTLRYSGFTFVEVLACLLVLGLGVTAAVGMVMYGVFLAARAQGKATGMATALSVAVDPTPLLPSNAKWSGHLGSGEADGYINNFYVIRHETASDDISLPSGFQASVVTVDVFDAFKGRPVASYSTRVLRQSAP